jgi:hypothetical protein
VSCTPPETLLARGDAVRLPLPDRCVDLVFGSPPYLDARTYGINAQRHCAQWVEWMLAVTTEAVRVSRGLVLWVCAGVTRNWCYQPGPEGLLWEWWSRGGHCWRPAFWHRVGIPGSGGKKWLRADVEYVLAFTGEGHDFWTDNTAMGEPPKYGPGGAMSYRTLNGERINQFRRKGVGARRAHGKSRGDEPWALKRGYTLPELVNPGNLIATGAGGGGQLGSDLAYENEAPFPEDLAEFFIRSFCPPGGIILDPFSGSGTTCAVAVKHDRRGIGLDLRMSQCELGKRRIAEGLRPVSKLDGARVHPPLAGQRSLFD